MLLNGLCVLRVVEDGTFIHDFRSRRLLCFGKPESKILSFGAIYPNIYSAAFWDVCNCSAADLF